MKSPALQNLVWQNQNDLILAFENSSTTGYWGFKDPRTLLTLPFWEKLLTKPVFIGTFRNPLYVAHSLCKRKDSPLNTSTALLLWNVYNSILMSKVAGYSIRLISFDQPSTDYQKKLKEIARSLALPTPDSIDFYDKTLVSNNHQDHSETAQNHVHLYTKMIQQQF